MSPEGTKRKLTAILSADVREYSRLMRQDEMSTIRTLTLYKAAMGKLIEDHRGRVVDSPGDNLLAEFESVVDAVNCAVELQRDLAERNAELPHNRKMEFRIGVNQGDVVHEDERIYGDGVNIAARLESLADGGGICISGKVYDEVKSKLGLEYEDLGEQSVKNIAESVRVYRVLSVPGAAAHRVVQAKQATARKWRKTAIGVAAALVVIVGAAVVWQFLLRSAPPPAEVALQTGLLGTGEETADRPDPILAMPRGPSMAVLPFDDLGGDDGSEYFADGLVEDIITALSRFPNLMVFAGNTTFQYKGAGVSPQVVHQELGADYVLEGSVRRGANRLRVTAQLIDAATAAQVWAESFDRELSGAGVFEIQDEITGSIVATLADTYGVLSRVAFEKSRRKAPDDFQSYECVAAAHAFYRTAFSPEMHLKARDCLEGAVEKDPDYAEAWSWLAAMYRAENAFGFNAKPKPLERAMEAARRAIAIDPQNQQAHLVLAHVYFLRHDRDAFFVEAERTLDNNPNSADALSAVGFWIAQAGQHERGMALVRKAVLLDPKFPNWWYLAFGYEHFVKGEYEAALREYLKLDLVDFFWMYSALATTYGHLGRSEDAARASKRLLELYPNYGDHAREEYAKWWWRDEDVKRALDGLRKAGLKIPELTH